ncbi:hypothetical protein GMA7_85 [Gordonia phage GMA7]|uniref:Uncharacterized protein n=2 Tax=Getseptimavirus TaxID=2560139 RepID=A0A0K0N709_9CAUD|nr:hypothetical protein AU104_gp033 [Gordonia phage GMA7]AKJ72522.1 hypothetical protein GMA7_85 [Gordonia phage GMA7]
MESPDSTNTFNKGVPMSKTIKRNSTRVNNQIKRGRRLSASERREVDRMMSTSLAPIVGFVFANEVRK